MLNQLFNFLKAKTVRFKYTRTLGSITDIEDFRKLIQKVQPQNFLRYQNASSCKRLEFQTVIDELQIILSDKRILDIGPVYGDSLDICYERGAKAIHFVEKDLFFFTYNKLKGFTKGYQIDHRRKLSELEDNKYDLIWVKGAFSADHFITRTKFSRFLNLESWLMQIERIASPSCQIIICPHWLNYRCKRNIENVKGSYHV